MEQYLGVGVPVEAVPAGGQCGAQLGCVVKFAVIDEDVGFALPIQLHGLQAVFQVNDRQPRVDERCPAADKHASLVRPRRASVLLHGAVGRIPALIVRGRAPPAPQLRT